MTTKYAVGTVTVTNDSNIVVGVGTKWLSSLVTGNDLFTVSGGKQYAIAKVIDDTHIGLLLSFAEATAAAQAYTIERNFSGVTLNDVAKRAALIGEFMSNTVLIGAAVAETSATPVDLTSILLPYGEWDVSGIVNRSLTGVTATQYAAAISPTVNTVPAQAGGSGVSADSSIIQDAVFGATITGNYVSRVGPVRCSAPIGGLTVHLVAADTFSAGTVGLFGTIDARRVG